MLTAEACSPQYSIDWAEPFEDTDLLQDTVLSTIQDWAQEPSYRNNATVLLVVGLIYAAEDNYVEALRACHTGISLEL